MKNHVNPEGIKTPIEIRSQMTQNWLPKLKYEYKDVCKDVFIDRHECLDVLKDQNNFLSRIEDLKPYMIKFYENSAMKPKIHPSDWAMKSDDC